MGCKIQLNSYIKADVVADIISQNIAKARMRYINENTDEAKNFLDKLLLYDKEVKKGNNEIMNKILKGDV